MKNKLILFDVDYTLFDTTFYRDEVSRNLKSKLPEFTDEQLRKIVEQTYFEIRQHGNFTPRLFAELFTHEKGHNLSVEEVEAIWWDRNLLRNALFPEVKDVLQKLKEMPGVRLGVFSTGIEKLQMAKIEPILSYFDKNAIHIFEVKDTHIAEVYAKHAGTDVVIVDDVLWVLEQAKHARETIITVWMKRGMHAEKTSLSTYSPDRVIATLQELPTIVSSLS